MVDKIDGGGGSVDGCDRGKIVKSWAARWGLMCSLFFYLKIKNNNNNDQTNQETFIGKI
jgi:hypothetical protein